MVSVIVPVYNTAQYLEQCILSICDQTCRELEIIAVDDGSTDGSGALLDELAEKDHRIRVIHQHNGGVSAARNAGIAVAHGDYLAFVDSDDLLEPDMYETLIKLAEEHQADIAHCGYKKIQLDGITKDVQGTGRLLLQSSQEATECLLTGKYFVGSPCNKIYRRELFDGVRFETALKINEDVLVNVLVFRKARKLVFLDVPKYHYYEREGSSCSRTDQLRKDRDCAIAAEKMLEACKGSELETVCARRAAGAQIQMYRSFLMSDIRGTKAERAKLRDRISEILPLCGAMSSRSMLNYRFMRFLPVLYRLVYAGYDRVRKPNWDL